MYIDRELALLFTAFVNWGFMMALLYNMVSYSEPRKRAASPLWLCLVINLSYLSTSFLDIGATIYIVYPIADLLTVAVLIFVQNGRVKIPALYYCVFGLSANASLNVSLYVDLVLVQNGEPWWLWSLYSIGINVNDAMMIIALIVNKDYLGLCRAGRYLKAVFQR
ncbi:hypothetical protein AAEU32_08225 [Pseudoalteromonas sp. SSDWG2]|uniref:hypothetical protein n=1 Tax=Pseudoalteromonas sp. SSDWG2 TaxID=3139391 RepID=UPI003BA8AD4F